MKKEIYDEIREVANTVYKKLGAGHEEVIYREAMCLEFQERGYTVKTEIRESEQGVCTA
ncbi:MAG: GxxExxY protein [Candidatus Methanospirareceae archaeon]